MYLKPSRRQIFFFLAVLSLIHIWAVINSGYFYIWWLDKVLHFFGGIWLGMLAIFVLVKYDVDRPGRDSFFIFLMALSMVSLGGVLWEFFEYGYDVFFAKNGIGAMAQLGLDDTMGDLFFDLIGGIAAHSLFLKRKDRLLL